MTRMQILFVVSALLLAGAPPSPAQTAAASRVEVDAGQRFQVIDGFGVNFNGTYFRESQKPMIDMLIDDLGATIFRLDPYGLLNWEAANDNDDPQAMNWEYYNDRYSIPTFEASWAAARYLNSRGVRPFLTLSGIAPAWMLDDKAPPPRHKVCGGDAKPGAGAVHLNPAMYDEFAEEAVSMAAYARTKARIDFEYFSPLNETDCYPAEGPRVDPDEMPKLLLAIARRMRKEGLGDVKLVVADQALLANNYIGPILETPELMPQVGAFSLHSYSKESITPHVERVRASKYANIPVWLTEYGDLDDLDRTAGNEWRGFCLAATRRALRALNEGATAALFWDAYDNYHEHYPRLTFYGLVRNSDHMYAPKKGYYAAKQLYHFVRPGAQRIAAKTDSAELLVSAFRDDAHDSIVIVGLKQGGPNKVRIALSGMQPAPAAWQLYQTTPALNCVRFGSVAVREGGLDVDLPDESIFTLVGTREGK